MFSLQGLFLMFLLLHATDSVSLDSVTIT